MQVEVFAHFHEFSRHEQRTIVLTRNVNWAAIEDWEESVKVGTDPTDEPLLAGIEVVKFKVTIFRTNPRRGTVRVRLERLGERYDEIVALARSVGFNDV